MSFFEVTSSQLRTRAEELSSLDQKLIDEANNLEMVFARLKDSWIGSANDSFTREFVSNKGKIDSFTNCIKQYTEALLVIAEKYDEAENKNLSIASSKLY